MEHDLNIPFLDASLADVPNPLYRGLLIQKGCELNAPIFEAEHTRGRPLAIFVHGMASHKNGIIFRPLAEQIDIDSYRYDQRGEGETPGEWTNGAYDLYADELNHIVQYLEHRFGYVVKLFICHSRGCAITYGYVGKYLSQGSRQPPAQMVMMSGRFDMRRAYELLPELDTHFNDKGYVERHLRFKNGTRTVHMTRQDFINGCEFPTPKYVKCVPPSVQVYILHGTSDQIVPMIDSASFVNVLTAQTGRQPGTVRLDLLEGCDHNYSGNFRSMVTEQILQWLNLYQVPEPCKPSVPTWTANSPQGYRGALIVVEGLDRAGKSTQVERLVATLHARLVKFPDRTTQIGKMINSYLTNAQDINDEAIHLLFSANRWEIIGSIIETLSSGQPVVCDRYAFSGIAYSRAKGLGTRWCVNPDVGIPMPDLTIFLDLDEVTAASRCAYGDERYERQEFQRIVRRSFLEVQDLVQETGGTWHRIQADGTPDQVFEQVNAAAQRAVDEVKSNHATLRPMNFEMQQSFQQYASQRPSL
ncbi:dTMP kinase [Malassezia yamatoensis]|uniref:Thymidylate kinase n=1 Tax=Malassezia yamatoensis TaxID=253288 RepID=A0AAJ6CH43_9BASI|nr:dTMP kinase [Malassezia yamatoensis]